MNAMNRSSTEVANLVVAKPRSLTVRALAIGVTACLMAACASTPQRPPELVRLENELSRLQADPMVAGNAGTELNEARTAIAVIAGEGRGMKADLFDHNVYIADRLLQIAEAEGRATGARMQTDTLSTERERLVADARTMEADFARRDARMARSDADLAQIAANEAISDADRARAEAEAQRQQASMARDEASMARDDADIARAQLEAMSLMLSELEAKQTERGLVVTLGDVLFETARAELKPGAQRNLDKLAAALNEHSTTTVAIEGHTDSVGEADFNIELSRMRALSVEQFLMNRGVDRSRFTVAGLGEEYPVASNDNDAGRQQNRRVEIIIQNVVATR
ncbi:MAG: OmpA family protein [Pseudomarimonas sp.]